MKPSLRRKPAGAGDGVAQRNRPVVLEQDQRRRRVVRDVLEHVPRVLVGEDVHAVAHRLRARPRAGLDPSSPSMPRPISAPTLVPSSIASSIGQVAQVRHLDLSGGVLVNRKRVDDAHRVALAQALELLDDLAVELGMVEPEDDELDWSDGHLHSFRCSHGVSIPQAMSASPKRGEAAWRAYATTRAIQRNPMWPVEVSMACAWRAAGR